MDAEGAVNQVRRRGNDLATALFTELHRLMVSRVSGPSDTGRQRDILHQPYPLADRLRPDFFIGPTDLCWPIGGVVYVFGFDSDRKRSHHWTGTDAVEGRPIIALAVHQAG